MDPRDIGPLRPCALGGLAAVALALTVLVPCSQAFQADADSPSDLEVLPGLEQSRYLFRAADIADHVPARIYTNRLTDELGPGWRVTSWNQFSGTARSVQGPGIVVAPDGVASADAATIEAIARAFVAEHSALFATDGSNLVTERISHGANRWGVIFHQEENGVRVQDTEVVVAIHDNGRLFAFGSHLYPAIDVALIPSVSQAAAVAVARGSVPFDAGADLEAGPDELVVVPIHREVGEVDFHLAHRTDVPTSAPYGLWRTWVDAHTGDIIFRDNQVEFAYEGTTEGDVEVFSPCNGDSPDTPHPRMTVNIDGVGSVDSDDNGDFLIPGNSGTRDFTAEFDGTFFDINCESCGGDAVMNGSIDPDAPLSLYFDLATYRPDERDAFHFANRTRMFIESIDPGFWVPKYTVRVNRSGCCNASWGGTVMNFMRAGCGCENMARVSDVVAHEFGHGVQDWALGGSQGPEGLGEGNADITATFITDDPLVGRGVVDCSSGARNCVNDLQYPQDLTGQIHHDGQIPCGFNWKVRENLETTVGFDGAKAHTAALWLFARKLYMNGSNNQPDQIERYFWVDDDDGNLENGTPNDVAICQAAMAHNFECPTPTVAVGDPSVVSTPQIARLGEATPNPFNPMTSIGYTLADASVVRLGIYDVSGRQIRMLVKENRVAGHHIATWDGTGDDGARVASGVYFYRLEVGTWRATRRMVMIK